MWTFSSFLKIDSLSLECKIYLFITVFYLLVFSKSTQGCKKASKTRVRIQDGDKENSIA